MADYVYITLAVADDFVFDKKEDYIYVYLADAWGGYPFYHCFRIRNVVDGAIEFMHTAPKNSSLNDDEEREVEAVFEEGAEVPDDSSQDDF